MVEPGLNELPFRLAIKSVMDASTAGAELAAPLVPLTAHLAIFFISLIFVEDVE